MLQRRQAGFQILAARAQRNIAIGNLFPQTQQATGDYLREALTTETANRSFVQKRFYGQWDFGFNLSWELDFWGRYRRAVESAEGTLDASVENYDGVLVTLLGDVATAYVQIRTLERQIALTRANAALQRKTLQIAQARYNKGKGIVTKLDVDQAQSNLSQTESQIPQLEIQEQLVRRIEDASHYVPLENLALSPQCGFASTMEGNLLTEDEQWRKLQLVVETARKVWSL